jgi:hypothetical protein
MDRMLSIALAIAALSAALPCAAQEAPFNLRRDQPTHAPSQEGSLSTPAATPEMWFYDQERKRHDDPRMAIRRRAEIRTQQREDRLASARWYGISNSRPVVSGTPWMGGYSSYWGSNTFDPMRWRAAPAPVVVAPY